MTTGRRWAAVGGQKKSCFNLAKIRAPNLPFHKQATQELKIKVAQHLLEGTLYLSASHHKFFLLGSKPLWA